MPKKQIVSRRLKGLMAEHDITLKDLSRKIGISENSLTLKINGQRDFWFWEIALIVRELGFTEIKDVFPELYSNASIAS